MKRVLGGLCGCVLFFGGALAQTYEFETEGPVYTQEQISGAFATCMAQTEAVAETKEKFPMPVTGPIATESPFAEQLEECVLWTLEGSPVRVTPLN